MEGQMDAVGDVFKMKDLYWHQWRAAKTIQFSFFRYRQRKLKKELRPVGPQAIHFQGWDVPNDPNVLREEGRAPRGAPEWIDNHIE